MVKHFTIADWTDNIRTVGGNTLKGIVITQAEHLVQDPVIQVFEQQKGEPNHYHLIYQPGIVHVGVSNVEVVLLAPQPFNGKVVIK